MSDTYKIVRFFAKDGKPPKVQRRGLTLAEAQAHCKREDTHKTTGPQESQWFDGYSREEG
jgi:hypothetical protein